MGLIQLNFAGLNKIEVAIARLKEFEPPEGYYFADSYGSEAVRLIKEFGNEYYVKDDLKKLGVTV